jgi:multisubunit Na+/H+ antiporter MnhE subunit
MPDRPGVAAVADALAVRRNAIRGFGFGVALAVFVLVFFVLLPGANYPVPLYLALGFVLAFGAGVLATVVLVAIRAYRLAQEQPDLDPSELPYRE